MSDGCHHKVIDIFVLFILHSIGSRKKAVEALFSSKVKAGLFSEVLMSSAFGAHTAVSATACLLPVVKLSTSPLPSPPLPSPPIPSHLISSHLISSPSLPPHQVLREFFPSVLSLCETLLCSGSASVSHFAVSLYQHVFTTFDVYCQQVVSHSHLHKINTYMKHTTCMYIHIRVY